MTKTPSKRKLIDEQRDIISYMLTGADTTKRLNNFNWLRHEISYTEPRTLFYRPINAQMGWLDHTNMKNIGNAYDYILETAATTPVSAEGIRNIHAILCQGTNLEPAGGYLRHNDKVLEIRVNGDRMHAPAPYEVEYMLNQIAYKINHDRTPILNRAWDAHYELIALQPFEDFNKRTARLVMNWILIRGGYRPIVFNKPSDKQKYIQAFAAYANGDRKEYIGYMQECMVRTQRQIIQQINKSRI